MLIALAILFSSFVTNAQAPDIQWAKCYGGSSEDWANAVQQTSDGGYIIVGLTISDDGDVTGTHGTTYPDVWIVKTNDTGKIQWSKTMGGSYFDYANAVQQTKDGGYIVAAMAGSWDGDLTGVIDSNHATDMWIIKLNAVGEVIWQKCLGGSGEETATSIQQTTDGGYIVAGQAQSDDGDVIGIHKDVSGRPSNDVWIVKLDDKGSIVWQKTLGGSNTEIAQSVQQTKDGGYIVAGSTGSNDGDVTKLYGAWDGWIIKLSDTGGLIWQKTIGGTHDDILNSVVETTDGGYILTGQTGSNDHDVSGNHLDTLGNATTDLWVVKIDSLGTINWQKCYGGKGIDVGSEIQPILGGGYVVAGYSTSTDGDVTGSRYRKVPSYDYWALQITNSGDINWNKCMGGTDWEYAYSIKETDDRGYVVVGAASSLNGDVMGNHDRESGVNGDFWLVKLAKPLVVDNTPNSPNTFQIFPNPTHTAFTIQYHFAVNENASIEITDVTGRIVNVIALDKNTTQINVSNWQTGAYFYKIIQNDITIATGKLLKE